MAEVRTEEDDRQLERFWMLLALAGIAAGVAEERGVGIGRTSHRLRNPDNVPPPWAEDLVAAAGEWIDVVKLGWGSARLSAGDALREKVETYAAGDIKVCTGGTFLELAFAQDRVDTFLSAARDLGIDMLEVSDGIHPMSADDKAGLIAAGRGAGFTVWSEVGKKDPEEDARLTISDRIAAVERDLLDAGGEIGGVHVAARGRLVAFTHAAWRVAAQRHDMAHAEVPIVTNNLVDLFAGSADAGEMRGRGHSGFVFDPANGVMGTFPGRAAGTVGDRDKSRVQGLQPPDGAPQRRLHLRHPEHARRGADRGNAHTVCGLGHHHADDGVARGGLLELHVGRPRRRRKRDGGDQFAGLESRLEQSRKKTLGRNHAPVGVDGGAEGDERRGVVAGRIVGGDGAAEGAAVADLRIGDGLRRLLQFLPFLSRVKRRGPVPGIRRVDARLGADEEGTVTPEGLVRQ